MKTIQVQIKLLEDMLGTASANKELHTEYIASKAPDAMKLEEEVAALGADEVTRLGMTVFPRTTMGVPFMWDYQIKGFFKDACSMLARVDGTESKKIKAYKKVIDGNIFVNPRRILIDLSGPIGTLERPLRAQTAQGERIALANSETVPAGSTLAFDVVLMRDQDDVVLKEWLDYGKLRGLGQWRNSGCGRFEVIDLK